MPNNPYIIWDFDGTLAFRHGMWSGTLLEILHAHNLAPSLAIEHIRPYLMSGFRWHNHHHPHPPATPDQWWQELEPLFENAFRQAANLPQPHAAELAKKVRHTYVHSPHWQLFPDVTTTLTTLSAAGWRHILLSNHVPELRHIMQTLSLDHHFSAIFNSAETGLEKPHRQAFENVCRTLPPNSRLWMVGDNFTADVQGAQSAGIPAILVRKPNPAATRFSPDLSNIHTFLE